MNIITLTTDFGERDYSVGAIKGALYSNCNDIRIVDISHSIAPYDILQAAYVLSRAYTHFPDNSIHIIGIDATRKQLQRQLIMKYDNHYFIGADNGILSFISDNDTSVELVEIDTQVKPCSFPTLKILVPIATALACGEDFKSLGKITNSPLKDVKSYTVDINNEEDVIRGNVIYIDHYGNVVTNITREIFDRIGQGREFVAYIGGNDFKKIYNSYDEFIEYSNEKTKIHDGKALLLFNCTDNIELAIYKSNLDTVGGANTLFGIKYRDQISISFK